MTKKNTLKWRLGKLPSVHELDILVRGEMLTKDEAREILFSQESEEELDKKSLKSEIKFLRELIDTLSKDRPGVVVKEIIRYQEPYYKYEWYKPYYTAVTGTTTMQTGTVFAASGTTGNILSNTASSINLASLK